MPLAIAQEQVVQRIAKTPQHATWTIGMAQTLKGNVGNFGPGHFVKKNRPPSFEAPKSGVRETEKCFPGEKCQGLEASPIAGVLLAADFCFFEERYLSKTFHQKSGDVNS